MKPMEQFYNIILKRRPHMLIYPSAKDPHILEQLTRYSIAPDIHLYEVPSKYFLNEEAAEQLRRANSVEGVEKYELTETKPNTLLTLSLEAERALHNVYVLADDVLREIKEKGSFTAPKVFLKYHGYIMVELRDKPFSTMQCYKNTKYSPIDAGTSRCSTSTSITTLPSSSSVTTSASTSLVTRKKLQLKTPAISAMSTSTTVKYPSITCSTAKKSL